MTDAAVVAPEPPLRVTLAIELKIRPDLLSDEMREWCERETVAEGFPITPENTAWFYAQSIADEAASERACQAEVCP